MRVALARSLTGGETEGKNSRPFIIKGAWNLCVCVALRQGCCLYVFKCFCFSAPRHSRENISLAFPRWSITCTPEASQLIIQLKRKILESGK